MHRELIIKAFEKAKKEVQSVKLTHSSSHLSDYISEESGVVYGEKSLRTYYKKAIGNSEDNIEFKEYVKESLSKFLGYDDYQHYLKENLPKRKQNNNSFISNINKKKTTIGSIIIALFITYFGYDVTKKECMIWVDNSHYEKIRCENEDGISIPKNKVIFNNLRRVEPKCDYQFFKTDGSENLWYGRSVKGELEFFTYYGLHPQTGKTLDPITQYMIDKYICKE